MAHHDRTLLKVCDGSPGRQVHRPLEISACRLKLIYSILLIFTAGCVMFLITQSVISDQKKMIEIRSFLPWNRPSPTTPSQNLQKTPDDEVYNSELFRAFVKTKTFSSVSEYFRNVSSYLQSFRSPMIKEDPSQYSWPETDSEKKQRESVSKTKHIVWYNPPSHVIDQVKSYQFAHCPVKDCIMSLSYKNHAKADAVVVLGGTSNAVLPRDHANQIYIFYNMEPPWLVNGRYRSTGWNTAFNWTRTYRLNSDIISIYGFIKRSPSVPSLSQVLKVKRQKKKLVAWMVSHCNVPSRRDEYVRKLQKIIPVDIYGRCGNLTCRGTETVCNLRNYHFYLSFENSVCVDYVTEKLLKTFNGVVIPVVRGGANYSRYYPAGTLIDADRFPGPEELGRYLLALAQDEARYAEMLWRHNHFVFHEWGSFDAHCQLCYKLHHMDRFKRTYPDMHRWYHRNVCTKPKPF